MGKELNKYFCNENIGMVTGTGEGACHHLHHISACHQRNATHNKKETTFHLLGWPYEIYMRQKVLVRM